MAKCFVIAELGSNPARYGWQFNDFCANAKLTGADAVKVQLFLHDHFPLAEQNDKRKVEFPRERLLDFVSMAHLSGLQAGASVFDAEAVELVARHCDFIKLAAREQDNNVLVNNAVFASQQSHFPSKQIYRSISRPSDTYASWGSIIIPFATIPEYPTRLIDALRGVFKWAKFFKHHYRIGGTNWGWSSHTRSIWDCVLAARLGARVIEKHFALNCDDIEAGHSLLPADFKHMTDWIRRV